MYMYAQCTLDSMLIQRNTIQIIKASKLVFGEVTCTVYIMYIAVLQCFFMCVFSPFHVHVAYFFSISVWFKICKWSPAFEQITVCYAKINCNICLTKTMHDLNFDICNLGLDKFNPADQSLSSVSVS